MSSPRPAVDRGTGWPAGSAGRLYGGMTTVVTLTFCPAKAEASRISRADSCLAGRRSGGWAERARAALPPGGTVPEAGSSLSHGAVTEASNRKAAPDRFSSTPCRVSTLPAVTLMTQFLAGTNSNPSSLHNFGHVDKAKWLTFHQIGNRRTHNYYALLTEIFNATPAVPGINGEPYYAGMHDAPGGTTNSALYCRSGMYGSVLSGGLGGHIYGAGGWDGGLWGGNVEKVAQNHIWDAMKWPSGDQMRHLATFILSEGRRYQDLVPRRELLEPNESGDPKGYTGWAYCARTDNKNVFLLYFEKDCPKAKLSGALFCCKYKAQWFNTRTGVWIDAGVLKADPGGDISLPDFPDHSEVSQNDWALKLTLLPERSQ